MDGPVISKHSKKAKSSPADHMSTDNVYRDWVLVSRASLLYSTRLTANVYGEQRDIPVRKRKEKKKHPVFQLARAQVYIFAFLRLASA